MKKSYLKKYNMNKKEYQELLKREEWQNKRLVVLKRDNYKCVKCNCKKNLHVHHTYYLIDRMPWQVPDDCLITLCKVCHKKEHKGRSIQSFMRKRPPRHNIKKLSKEKRRYDNMIKNLSKKDRELQEKYNKIRNKLA